MTFDWITVDRARDPRMTNESNNTNSNNRNELRYSIIAILYSKASIRKWTIRNTKLQCLKPQSDKEFCIRMKAIFGIYDDSQTSCSSFRLFSVRGIYIIKFIHKWNTTTIRIMKMKNEVRKMYCCYGKLGGMLPWRPVAGGAPGNIVTSHYC